MHVQYCTKCGSLMLRNSCSNARCSEHIEGVKWATHKQKEKVLMLLARNKKSISKDDLFYMSGKEAKNLIREYRT